MPDLILFGALLVAVVAVAAAVLMRPRLRRRAAVRPEDLPVFGRVLENSRSPEPPAFQPSRDQIMRRMGVEPEPGSKPEPEPKPKRAPEPRAEPEQEPTPHADSGPLGIDSVEALRRLGLPEADEHGGGSGSSDPATDRFLPWTELPPAPDPRRRSDPGTAASTGPIERPTQADPERTIAPGPTETVAGPIGTLRGWVDRWRGSAAPGPPASPSRSTERRGESAPVAADNVQIEHHGARVWRVLQGDGVALEEAAEVLADGDAQARAAWTTQLQRFFEAVLAQALEDGLIDLPSAHPFWGLLTQEQRRLTLDGLATLGYRFDGVAGWQDGRVPTRRDLSLVLGTAGVDPVRVRSWPSPDEMRTLLAEATIAGTEYLKREAPDLSRPQVEPIVGRQGTRLKVLADEWDRVRAALVER